MCPSSLRLPHLQLLRRRQGTRRKPKPSQARISGSSLDIHRFSPVRELSPPSCLRGKSGERCQPTLPARALTLREPEFARRARAPAQAQLRPCRRPRRRDPRRAPTSGDARRALQPRDDEPSTMPPSPLIQGDAGGLGSVDIPAPIIPTGSTASGSQTILRMPSR